jgi:hypothetical protein
MNGRDDRLSLEPLDPGHRDPGFWIRFHQRVMADAQKELARRRMAGGLSVVEVVFSWRKTVVPLALMAAALAGLLLLGPAREEPAQVVALEEVLTEDLNLLSTSGVLSGEKSLGEGVLAGLEGGF